MGVFDKLGQAFGVTSAKEISIEDYMNTDELKDVDLMHEPADMYVKPVSITHEEDVKLIEAELMKKNIILLSMDELAKRPTTRGNVITALKAYVTKINGDIAQVDESRVLITPAKVKIIKRRKSAADSK